MRVSPFAALPTSYARPNQRLSSITPQFSGAGELLLGALLGISGTGAAGWYFVVRPLKRKSVTTSDSVETKILHLLRDPSRLTVTDSDGSRVDLIDVRAGQDRVKNFTLSANGRELAIIYRETPDGPKPVTPDDMSVRQAGNNTLEILDHRGRLVFTYQVLNPADMELLLAYFSDYMSPPASDS